MSNVILCPSFQELLRVSLASAAAVLTILSPTSSPWGALPSPWPHLWSSPAIPCITAVKTKTSQRRLRPPRPCMKRDPRFPPMEPLSRPTPPSFVPDWPTNNSQNQYTKTSAVLALHPVVCHPDSTLFSPSLYERLNTLSYPSRLLSLLTNKTSCFPHWIHWDWNTCTVEISPMPFWVSTLLPQHVSRSLLSPFCLRFYVSWRSWKCFFKLFFPQESTRCQIPASVRSYSPLHLLTWPTLKLFICAVGHLYHQDSSLGYQLGFSYLLQSWGPFRPLPRDWLKPAKAFPSNPQNNIDLVLGRHIRKLKPPTRQGTPTEFEENVFMWLGQTNPAHYLI